MLIFIDTEFTDFLNPDLISIELVREDGGEFYGERNDFKSELCSEFVTAVVLPKLGKVPGAVSDRDELSLRLHTWFNELSSPGTVVFDFSTDLNLLVDLLLCGENRTLPRNLANKIHLSFDVMMSPPVFQRAQNHSFNLDWPPHHALADARALRAGYLAMASKGFKFGACPI